MKNKIDLVNFFHVIRDNYQFQTNEKKVSEKMKKKQCDVTCDYAQGYGFSITLSGIGLRLLIRKAPSCVFFHIISYTGR